jgi:uncharacterized membrane protein
VPAAVSGYIQSVDYDALLGLARDSKTIVRMERGTGAFVVQNTALASLALTYPPDRAMISALNGAYSISRHRTVEQDAAFGIRQIVDMALKALSPGVNDTSTAVMCVDYLTAILAQLAVRQFPSVQRYDGEALRVITVAPTFDSLLAEAFDQIRGSAEGNVAIMARMLGAIDTIASLTVSPSRRRALDEQVQWIAELADRTIESTHDRARIERRLGRCARRSKPSLLRAQGKNRHSLVERNREMETISRLSNSGVFVSVRGSVVDVRFGRRGDQRAKDHGAQWHAAQHRAWPLIGLLKNAVKANVMWDRNN